MNSVELIGRLTRDPELRKAASGTSIFKFTLAVNRRFKQPGQPDADFISCTAFGKTADIMCQYLHKGSLIGVTGRIQTGSYDNQQGQRVYTTDVIIDNFEFLESRNASQGSYAQNGYQQNGGYSQNQNYGYGGGQGYAQESAYNAGYSQEPSGASFGSYGQNPSRNSYQPNPQNTSSRGTSSGNYAPAQDDDLSGAFDDSDTLDIATDDLPF